MFTLSDQQNSAVKAIVRWFKNAIRHDTIKPEDREGATPPAEVFYLAGFAGSGKTSILPTIIEALCLKPHEVAYGAPTGKAAKVMTEKLKAFGMESSVARTIHSLIYVPNRELIEKYLDDRDGLTNRQSECQLEIKAGGDEKALKSEIKELQKKIDDINKELNRLYDRSRGPSFSINPSSILHQKRLLVIDEASMVGTETATDLRYEGVPILAIGDPGQLPPVGDAPGLCVGEPDFFLSEIHRQARDNPIIRLSQLVREGGLIKPSHSSGDGRVIVQRRRDDDATYDLDRDAQVLVGTNRNRWRITKRLRKAMDYHGGPNEHEPLIICRNSRKFPVLVNGTFVECAETVEMEDGDSWFKLRVLDPSTGQYHNLEVCQGLFEENFLLKKGAASCGKEAAYRAKTKYEHVDFGHAITVHKSQGSQWDDVIVHDESGVFRDDAEKWLYTAVTRAAERLTVII